MKLIISNRGFRLSPKRTKYHSFTGEAFGPTTTPIDYPRKKSENAKLPEPKKLGTPGRRSPRLRTNPYNTDKYPMAVNPLIASPQVTLSQAANQSLNQSSNAAETQSVTRATQTQDSGFNANIGKQNTELKNPKINQDTKTTDIQTPNTSQQASDGLKNAEVPKIPTDQGDPKFNPKNGTGVDLNKTDTSMTPEQAKEGLSDTGIIGSFKGYLKQKATDYMTNQIKGSTNQSAGDSSGPKENSTPGNYKPNETGSAPQRPETQTARANAPAAKPATTPSIPNYNKPVSQPPAVPKIPKPATPSFKKPF